MKMSREKLDEILERHKDWLKGEDCGGRANLYGADLYEANLYEADLRGANLRGANLRGANLYGANLRGADLYEANLYEANLGGANLGGANLGGANLRGANLYEANLYEADLRGAIGGNRRIESLQVYPYRITILDKQVVWGGCTKKTAHEWLEYEGKELMPSDKTYLETVTKPFIRMVLALNNGGAVGYPRSLKRSSR